MSVIGDAKGPQLLSTVIFFLFSSGFFNGGIPEAAVSCAGLALACSLSTAVLVWDLRVTLSAQKIRFNFLFLCKKEEGEKRENSRPHRI